jgi:transposase-like protein
MENLIATLATDRLSTSQVSETSKDLGAQGQAFRIRQLDAGPAFVAADALVLKVREGRRTVTMRLTGIQRGCCERLP